MSDIINKRDYEEQLASTRAARMGWWRDARFGMFIHFGVYSVLGRNEWVMARENIPVKEYELLTERFLPEPGAPRKWAQLAKAAGIKYMVLTTRHHEGFSLWDSKVNPYNSVNYGPHRDIVREFVDACREFGLKIGFYSSLMDWHHPDGYTCAYDNEARRRFLDYIEALNTELLTNYGKIDILWYDVANPMNGWEAWDSLARNQRLRKLQPDIIINDRSFLPEDFGTPEGEIRPCDRDWEACMTFNGFSWGYLNPEKARPYAYSAQQILLMVHKCAANGGNLLLNIGPAANGDVPADAIEPLTKVGRWLEAHAEAVYGPHAKGYELDEVGYGNSNCTATPDRKTYYVWNWLWPDDTTISLGSAIAPKRVTVFETGEELEFEQKGYRLIIKNLPKECPDKICGIGMLKVEFDEAPKHRFAAYLPQFTEGKDYTNGNML